MSKEIGNLAIVVSANTAALDAGLANAQASVQRFGSGVNASMARMSQAFAPSVVRSTGLIASEHNLLTKYLNENAKAQDALNSSMGVNFVAAGQKVQQTAAASSGQLRDMSFAFSLVGRAAAAAAVVVGSFKVGRSIRDFAFADHTAKAHEFANTLGGSVEEKIAAVTARIQEMQAISNEGGWSAITEVDALLSGMTSADARKELDVLRTELERLSDVRLRGLEDAENTAARENRNKEVAAYQDAANKKADIHRQLVDQINQLSIENAADPLARLRLERDVEIAKIQEQFSGKVEGKAFDQLQSGVIEKYRRAFDALANNQSDISGMFEEDVETGAKAGLHNAMAENKFTDLIRSGSAAAQTLSGRTAQSSMASTLNKQLEVQKAANRSLKAIEDQTEALASLEVVDF